MKAFTIIETLIVVVIFGLALAAVTGFIVMIYRTSDFSFQQSQAIFEARKGIESMVKEIREARIGDDGAFLIESASDYEFVFYSDIDRDEQAERVRYFISPAGGHEDSLTDQCVSFSDGGSCSVSFLNFLGGNLESAQVGVSVEGDLNSGNERVEILADGVSLGTLCTGGDCGQCSGSFEDLTNFDVTAQAADNLIQFTAECSSSVDAFCDWQQSNHSVLAQFEFSWQETAVAQSKGVFKKGVTQPTGWPIRYLEESEEVFIVSENVMNEIRGRPVFTYFDGDYNQLLDEDRLEKTTLMHLELIINVNPNRPPQDFSLESDAQIRNLKINL